MLGTDPPLCMFHKEGDHGGVFKAMVIKTPQFRTKKHIRLLMARLNAANRILDEVTKTKLTLELINKIEALYTQLEKMEAEAADPAAPAPGSTAEKLAAWKKEQPQQ
jgi:RNA processing factor Prp31